jgi:hypothetical protein
LVPLYFINFFTLACRTAFQCIVGDNSDNDGGARQTREDRQALHLGLLPDKAQ